MRINTALIMCAGFGKRLNPLTLNIPKPLLEINNLTLLENTINLVKDLDIKQIKLNTFYMKDQIKKFIEKKNFNLEIEIVEDGDQILDTGGGIHNMIKMSGNEEDFLILNPDTIWSKNYLREINQIIAMYFEKKIKNILLLADKDLSFDETLTGDFGLEKNLINEFDKKYIYTGCQILNRSVFINEKKDNFSINKIWSDLIKSNQLIGFESKLKFYHATNLNVFKKLQDL